MKWLGMSFEHHIDTRTRRGLSVIDVVGCPALLDPVTERLLLLSTGVTGASSAGVSSFCT